MQFCYKKIVVIFFLLFPLPTLSHTVFIIIHGTWASGESWYTPGGDFFDTLYEKAKKLNCSITTFRWSGKNFHYSRLRAAKRLVTLIKSYPDDTNVCLIGHSHGNNVGILASQMLVKKEFYNRPIHIFYALATPVNKNDYYPNMDTIDYFYNFFSFEDLVQPILGMFERVYPDHKRIANIRVTIDNKEPNHSQLHSSTIAQWLCTLHETITINFSQPGILHFTQNQIPQYEFDPDRYTLIMRDLALQRMILFAFRTQHLKKNF